MKSKTIASLLASLAAASLIAGCASTGYETGTKAASNIQKAADKITKLSLQVDTTLASLNDLVNNPKPDLRPQFKTFAANMKTLQSTATDITKARMAMGAQGKEFFAKWDEEIAKINNEDIKARSQARKGEVNDRLQAIKRTYAEVEMAFKPLAADLRDVQKFLSIDLTPAGVASMKDVAAKATQHAVPVKDSLSKLGADFKALGVSMSAVAPAAPAKK